MLWSVNLKKIPLLKWIAIPLRLIQMIIHSTKLLKIYSSPISVARTIFPHTGLKHTIIVRKIGHLNRSQCRVAGRLWSSLTASSLR